MLLRACDRNGEHFNRDMLLIRDCNCNANQCNMVYIVIKCVRLCGFVAVSHSIYNIMDARLADLSVWKGVQKNNNSNENSFGLGNIFLQPFYVA